jgi:outer membrane autotransporter protein
MAKKSNFIKNLLTTASAVAVLAGGAAESAFANERTAILNNPNPAVAGSTAAPFRKASVAADWLVAALANGDGVKFGDDSQTIVFDVAHTYASLNTDTKVAPRLSVKENVTLGNIFGTNKVDVTLDDGKTLTLNGTVGYDVGAAADKYAALGPVILGSTAGGVSAKIVINSVAPGASTFTNTFNGIAAGKGIIEVNTATTFDAAIGDTAKLEEVKITGAVAATFNKNVSATKVTLGNVGAITNLGAALANADVTLTGDVVTTNGNNGVLNFKGQNSKVVGNVGTNAANIASVTVDAGVNAAVTGNIYTNAGVTLVGVGSKLTIGDAANAGNTAIVGAAAGESIIAGIADTGVIVFEGKSEVLGNIGNKGGFAVDKIVIGSAAVGNVAGVSGSVELKGVGGVTKTKNGIEFANTGSTLTLSTNDQTITGDLKNTTATDGKGKISLANGADYTFKGKVGAANANLESITMNGNASLKFEQAALDLYVKDIAFAANAAGNIKFKADTVNIYGNIGDNVNKSGHVSIEDSVAVAPNSITTMTLKGGKIYAVDLSLTTAAAKDNILVLEDGSEVHANVITGQADRGIIQVKGDATIDGTIGANATAIDQIVFDTANKTLTVTKNSITTTANGGINFTQDATLALTEVANADIASKLVIAADANGKGTIKVNEADSGKTVTITGNIGDFSTSAAATVALQTLEAKGGAKVVLTPVNGATAGAYVKKIDIGDQDVELTLGEVGFASNYKIENFLHSDGKGTVELLGDTTFKAGTNLNTSAANAAPTKLNAFKFAADNTATLEDGVNIYATNGIRGAVAANGTLIFEGASIVDAAITGLKTIQITGKKVVDFKQNVDLDKTGANGIITLSDGSTAIFRGAVDGIEIKGANNVAAGQGTIEFANTEAKAEVDIAIGGNLLNTVKFSGQDVEFKQEVATKNLVFASATPMTATFVIPNKAAGAGVLAVVLDEAVSNTSNVLHNIAFEKGTPAGDGINFTISTDVATAAKPLGNVIIDKDMTVNVTTNNVFANITTVTAGKGKVNLNKVGGTNILGLGEFGGNDLEEVTFTENAKVTGDLNANAVKIAAGKTATLKNALFSGAMTLDNNSVASFTGQAIVSGTIAGNAANNGSITFDAGAVITKNIGAGTAVSSIKFTSANRNDSIELGTDLSAGTISFAGATLKPSADATLTGVTSFAGTAFDLSSDKSLKLTGGNITVSGDVAIKVKLTAVDQKIGKIVIDSGVATDLSGVTSLSISVEDTAELPGADDTIYDLITQTNGQVFSISQGVLLPVADNNKFASWTLNTANSQLIRSNNAAAVLKDIVGSSNANLSDAALKLGSKNVTGDAKAYQTDLGRMSDDQIKESLTRLANPIVTAADAVANAISGASQMTQNRIGELSQHPVSGIQTSDNGISGVSAGDMDERSRYGAWVSPFYNTSTKKANAGTSGYKSTTGGFSVGADTMTNADMSLGLALSYISTDVKHKDIKSGDKTKSNTVMFSIYGIQQLTDNWFLQGVASFSSSTIKNTEKRLTSLGYQVAKGEFDSTSYGTELLFGYMYGMDDIKVTPIAGIAMSRFNDGGYRETGTTAQNLTITKKAVNKLEGILGGRVEMSNLYAAEGIDLSPEVHAYARHNFLNSNSKVIAKLDGADAFAAKQSKASKSMVNLGTSLNVKSGMTEYGIGYDLNLSSKFVGHQGTLKMRVNF